MELSNKKALVVGFGRTGFETARFLKDHGASVTISELADNNDLGERARQLQDMGVHMEFGDHVLETFTRADLIIVSPGVPHTIPPIRAAKKKGIPLLGEIELASCFITEPIIAVTGTNGKTTTTELIGAMMKQSGKKVFVGGNIGTPLVSYLTRQDKVDCLVVEVSSFQLDTVASFKPSISVLLNISDDHLDRYPDFAAYARAKARLLKYQTAGDTAVLNGDDPWIRKLSAPCKIRKLFFSGRRKMEPGADIGPDTIVCHGPFSYGQIHTQTDDPPVPGHENQAEISLKRVPLKCRHEIENISAASLAVLAFGGNVNAVQRAIDGFKGLPHRMERVATQHGIPFYNDSKATNVDAVLRAIACLDAPIHLIMGGRDKGGRFDLLKTAVQQKVKSLILLGEAAKKIDAALGGCTRTRIVATMQEAVAAARDTVSAGDVVLLSPACASFDMYKDYKERGEAFRKAVCEGMPS